MEKILVSACLLGVACRYDGESKPDPRVIALGDQYELVPVCPEVEGGLPTPRTPSERVLDRVIMKDGTDVTENYRLGALSAYQRCLDEGIRIAVLKARSPSCGKGRIYDGSFSGRLCDGYGVTAEYLYNRGIDIYTEDEADFLPGR